MELEILRTYHAHGTNGILTTDSSFLCFTIELPWRENLPKVSCVPESRYELKKRYSPRFGTHLLLEGVPGRSLVLIHPANDALKELEGCIAPVSKLCGEGRGLESRKAFMALLKAVDKALGGGTIYLTIKAKEDENTREDTGAHAKVL